MATQGERRALIFLAAVALLGAGSRVYRSRHVSVDTTGLSRQLDAVDNLEVGRPRTKAKGRSSASRRPPLVAEVTRGGLMAKIDVDLADEAEIEKLPGIGPSLAKRIIKDRQANGPFGCLAALDRVKGVGPAMLARIDSLATFSAAGGAQCASGARPPEGAPRR